MPSINFSMAPQYPQVDVWGEAAENALRSEPDIALVRCRQLLELLVHAIEQRHGIRHSGRKPKLFERLDNLGARVPPEIARRMSRVRQDANSALHVEDLNAVGPRAWEVAARRAIETMAKAWAWFMDTPHAHITLPHARSVPDKVFEIADRDLDVAERLVEDERNEVAAERLLSKLSPNRLIRKGVPHHAVELLELRVDSIRLAMGNHQGLLPAPLNVARSRRAVATGHSRYADEVVHYHNRYAVGLLNRLQAEEALQAVGQLEEWRSSRAEFAPDPLANLQIRDWQRGALLGTKGQALCFLAHERRDPSLVDQALAAFAAARDYLEEPADLRRQDVYRLHALIEKGRLGGTLNAEELAVLDARIEHAPIEAIGEHWTPEIFAIAVALKSGWAVDRKVTWAGRLSHQLDAVWRRREPLEHPYELVAGSLLLVHPPSAPRLLASLQATADNGGLIGWIASCYIADHAGRPAPTPPDTLSPWWDRVDRQVRALDNVPYNYA
ncbi:MAG: hypothetical protein H6734_22995 [Alphaproteobacteria bacterium]|nr:hypothetical protein [Alphaproteobacteria bacterium]